MKRILLIAGIFLQYSTVFGQQHKQPTQKPNVIYIYADDLGYAEIGPYGQKKIKTPNLDRMAKEGMKFTDHYTGTPVCAPARAMLMTGKHGGHSYIRGNFELGGFPDSTERGQMPLKAGTMTVGRLMQQAGYKTALVGKWGLGMNATEGSPLNQGFDYYYGLLDQKQAHSFYPTHLWENEKWDTLGNTFINVHKPLDSLKATDQDFDYYKGKVYAPEKMTEKALAFIDKNKGNPFFLYLPYPLPHVSLQAPDADVQEYIGKFKEERPYYGQKGYAANKYPYATYAAMITFLDKQVGLIMQRLKVLGLDENTIIMFSSDNGTTFNGGVNAKFFNSVDGLRGLKMDVYEGGIREPFLARWPGKIKAGATTNLVSAQYDLLATMAELTGQKLENTDGISFLPTLRGKNNQQKKHAYLYFEYPEKGGQLAIRMGNWKGVRTNVKKDPQSPWQIFNLKTDRNETQDLAASQPELVKQFDEIVKKEHQDSHVKAWNFL
ncbi:arylsulfatase [Pedobacter caeni]|uniref:Arylsulfatase A n=1 Tax=Pedobacter caeni TaxID=288992 RepID=A0A1M5JJH7_9SPHI|nr:arylsulfatase [Pedobacter caeni]SHG40717.1 Arylsulfatase A [Pedobacter caeni]